MNRKRPLPSFFTALSVVGELQYSNAVIWRVQNSFKEGYSNAARYPTGLSDQPRKQGFLTIQWCRVVSLGHLRGDRGGKERLANISLFRKHCSSREGVLFTLTRKLLQAKKFYRETFELCRVSIKSLLDSYRNNNNI